MAVVRTFSTLNCQRSLFSEKNLIIRILCISGRRVVPNNPGKWTSTVIGDQRHAPAAFFLRVHIAH
jgi:hypothetical protein